MVFKVFWSFVVIFIKTISSPSRPNRPTFFDHLHHYSSGPPGGGLSDHPLADLPGVEAVVQTCDNKLDNWDNIKLQATESSDVTVCPDPLYPRDLPHLRYLGHRCCCHDQICWSLWKYFYNSSLERPVNYNEFPSISEDNLTINNESRSFNLPSSLLWKSLIINLVFSFYWRKNTIQNYNLEWCLLMYFEDQTFIPNGPHTRLDDIIDRKLI